MRQTSRRWLALLVVAGGLTLDGGAEARSLSFDERVTAQRAIEVVYWSHRIWPAENPTPKPPLSAVMSDDTLLARVDDALRKSNALEAWWQRPVTPEQLQAELDRMAAQSRDPGMLRELFSALGDDPFVIAETLARQNLVDRLIRKLYASDERSRNSFDSWWSEQRDALTRRIEESPDVFALPALGASGCMSDTWRPTSLPGPTPRWGHVAVWTGTEMIVWGGTDGSVQNTGGRYVPSTDTWTPTSTGLHVPSARSLSTAIWTGREMVVWGGAAGNTYLNTGGRYDPSSDTWAPTSTESAVPSARIRHTAIWTGREMVVWGGEAGSTYLNTGGRYDPYSDTWRPTSPGPGLPRARSWHTAVWTGKEMIVWGGRSALSGEPLNSGERYAPQSDSWHTTYAGPGAPSGRASHTAVWTGTEMIVWGGTGGPDMGARYDPEKEQNAWAPISATGAPSPRSGHSAIWTGAKMIIWGGYYDGYGYVKTGGLYDPLLDRWLPTSLGNNVPAPRSEHRAVWTGPEMILWGGYDGSRLGTGALYCACPSGAMQFPDSDGDGYGDPGGARPSCSGLLAPGFVLNADDCDDANASLHPGVPEICNGIDDDCDGVTDVDAVGPDSDGDGVADCVEACPNDPAKVVPGACGCNVPDPDADADGQADCIDECPADPAQRIAGLFGPEFQVNAYTLSQQGFPAVARLGEGAFVVVWTSVGQDGSLAGVYGRRFDGEGNALGDEFRINDYTPSIQTSPAVAADDGFGFVVAWMSLGQDGDGLGVFARRYDPTGQPLGNEFQVNVEVVGEQRLPSVALSDSGHFVVAWESVGQDGSGAGIHARGFDAAGQPLGGEHRVNARTDGDQSAPATVYVGEGEYVVAWHGPRIAADRAAYGRRFDAAGQALGDEFLLGTSLLNECCVDVARDPLGGFGAVWERQLGDGSGSAVFARRFDGTSAPTGPEFLVNTHTVGNQTLPAVAVDADDNLVAVWSSAPQDGSGYGVYGQRFDAADNALGGEFRLNEYTALDQGFPAIAANGAGRFLAAWSSAGQDGSSDGIFARRGVIDGDLDNDGQLDCGGPCLDTPPDQCCRPTDGALTPIDDAVACTLDACALDGSVSHLPVPIPVGPTLRLDQVEAGTLLSWSTASGTSWNVYRGSILPEQPWEYDETCFAAGLALPETVDADVPSAGAAFYYLVGAVDVCGESAIGDPSNGGEHFASPSCVPPGAP